MLDVTKYFGTTSGGIKTYLLEKARYVGSRPELRHIMVVPGAEDAIVSGEGWRQYQLRGPRIPAHPPYRFLLATSSFKRIVEHERPDVIEVGSPFFVPWLTRWANRRLQAPMVWYYHSHLPRLAAPDPARASSANRFASRTLEHYVRFLGAQFPMVICGSRFAARELATLGVSKIRRVPLGVDLDHWHPDRRARATHTRQALGLPEGPLALYAGRFATEKRVDVVLQAWPEIQRRTGFRLALVGDGPAAAALRAHPHAAAASWLPWQTDRDHLADLIASADLYLAPGPAETFGLSVLEAMASGLPVLGVDAGAGAELIQDSGAGRCYEDGHAEDLVAAAASLVAADLPSLGRQARGFAERHHDWAQVLDRTFGVYAEVASGKSAAAEAPR